MEGSFSPEVYTFIGMGCTPAAHMNILGEGNSNARMASQQYSLSGMSRLFTGYPFTGYLTTGCPLVGIYISFSRCAIEQPVPIYPLSRGIVLIPRLRT